MYMPGPLRLVYIYYNMHKKRHSVIVKQRGCDLSDRNSPDCPSPDELPYFDKPINDQKSPNRFAFTTETEVSEEIEVFVPNNTKRKATWTNNTYCDSKKQHTNNSLLNQPNVQLSYFDKPINDQ